MSWMHFMLQQSRVEGSATETALVINQCVSITLCTPPTPRDPAAEREEREHRTGDASASFKPDVSTCSGLTCTMKTEKAKRGQKELIHTYDRFVL